MRRLAYFSVDSVTKERMFHNVDCSTSKIEEEAEKERAKKLEKVKLNSFFVVVV